MPIPFEDGAPVEVRGETWRLARADRFDTCAILTLVGRDRSNAGARFRVVVPFDRPRPLAARKLRRRSRHAAMAAALNAVAGVRRAPGLWTAASAAIDLLPYQLEPALAVVGGATRLLLADAVGLGKTIQAGLILSELRERGWIEHALIVCPAGLRHTWARELCDRFHIPATILDQPSIAERIATLPPGISPWSGHGVAIASIDLVKRPEVLAAIDREPIDLVIADEAHHLAPGTDRGAAVSRLASRAPWCVFVSATPHSGDRAARRWCGTLTLAARTRWPECAWPHRTRRRRPACSPRSWARLPPPPPPGPKPCGGDGRRVAWSSPWASGGRCSPPSTVPRSWCPFRWGRWSMPVTLPAPSSRRLLPRRPRKGRSVPPRPTGFPPR